ncbi:hypothetical protein Tco_1220294 [Tanacetum coccineum]
MAHYVAPVAFGRTWTIMMIVAFRTQWLGLAVIFILPVPCSVIFASILPLVRLLLVLIVLESVSTSLLFSSLVTSTLITGVSSLIPSNSRIPTLPGHVVNLLAIPVLYSTLPIVVTFPLSLVSLAFPCYRGQFLLSQLSLSDSTFSDGGDDEGGVAATRLRTGSSKVIKQEMVARTRCSSSSPSSSSFSTSSSSFVSHRRLVIKNDSSELVGW